MRRRTNTLLAMVVLLLALAPEASAVARPCADARLQASPHTTARQAKATVCLINRQRSARGLGRLRTDPLLARAARAHAHEMVTLGFFDHLAPDGATPISRVRSTGWLSGARSWVIAENIAWGAGSDATPVAIVRGWMRSPGHRAAILDPRFAQVGLGLAMGAPDGGAGVTVTADFGAVSRTSSTAY